MSSGENEDEKIPWHLFKPSSMVPRGWDLMKKENKDRQILRSEYPDLAREMEEKDEEIKNLHQVVADMEKQLRDLRSNPGKHRENLLERIESQNSEITRLKHKEKIMLDEKQHFHGIEECLRDDCNILQGKLSTVIDRNACLENEKEDLVSKINILEDNALKLKRKMAAMTKMEKQLKGVLETQAAHLDIVTREHAKEVQDTQRKLVLCMQKMVELRTTAQTQSEKDTQEIDHLREKMSAMIEENACLENEKEDLVSEIKIREDDVMKLRNEVAAMTQKEKQLKGILESQATHLDIVTREHAKEVQDTKRKLALCTQKMVELRTTAQTQSEKNTQEIDHLKTSIEEARRQNDLASEERDILLSELQKVSDDYEDVKRILDKIRAMTECMVAPRDHAEEEDFKGIRRSHSASGSGHADVLQDLPEGFKLMCLHIQDLVGGNIGKLERELLEEDVQVRGRQAGDDFSTRTEFWKLIEKFVQRTQDKTSLQGRLQKACQALHPNPLQMKEMSDKDKRRLEVNFQRLRQSVMFPVLLEGLRCTGSLTEGARAYLEDSGITRKQRVSRLIDIVVSWGQDGLQLLTRALEKSSQTQLVYSLQQDPEPVSEPGETASKERQRAEASGQDTQPFSSASEEERSIMKELEDSSRPVSVRDLETAVTKLLEAIVDRMQPETQVQGGDVL